MSTSAMLPEVRYNFDIAVPIVVKYFGRNTMNYFFMSAYLYGFQQPKMHNMSPDPPQYGSLRLVLDQPEKRFWSSVYLCYCLDRKKHHAVCEVLLSEVDKFCSNATLQHHSKMVYAALQSAVKFFEPQHQGTILQEIQSEIGREDPNIKIWGLVSAFLTGRWGTNEHNRNKVDLSNSINSREHDSGPITLLKALRAVIHDIRPSERTQSELPFVIKLMQQDEYAKNLRDLEGEIAHEPLTSGYFNSNIGQIMHFQSKFMQVNPQYNEVLNRFKNLLFYINFDDRFTKFLKFFTDTHDVGTPALGYEIPQTTTRQGSFQLSNEDTSQLQWVDSQVRSWPNYQRVMRSEQPIDPKPVKKGGRSGS